MKLSELKKIIKEEVKLNEAPKIKANQKISKKEWRKIKSFNKHIGQDGTHYVMQLTNKGTALVPVVVEGNLKEGKLVKVPKDPVPPSAYKGPKKFNGLKDLKGEDKIAWLTWMGSHPQGKGSYEIDGKRLNVNGINPRDKGFYVTHFTQRTGIRKNNLYYDGKQWQTQEKFNEGKITEGTRTTTFGIPETDKKAVKQIIQKLKLKHGEHYDFGVGRGATFVLSVYKKYESAIVDAFNKYRVRFREVR